jgi:hypothetical protein
MTGLDSSSRNSLERLITKARRILEDDLAATAEGRFGIHKNGKVEDEDSLRLSPAEVLDRREVAAIVSHLRVEGASAASAVERLVREATFTHLNRLVAIRIAESIGILPPSLAAGKGSQGFRDVLEIAPLIASDQYGGYWFYLRLCADELAADAPILFDPRNPLLTLSPTARALDELVELLAEQSMADAWLAPDALGWVYQFFNSGDERREMREGGAPRTSRELAVRNQFFTPRYVVDFLVQNSLGRRLLEAKPNSDLADQMTLLVDRPTEPGAPLPLDQIRILDPACGSGHFLLGAYDLLEQAWQCQGIPPAEAAALILPCLYGIDIDPRCGQVASAALMLRARRANPSGPLPHPEVVTARSVSGDDDAWARVLYELPAERGRLVQALREALTDAPALGSLLRVEERLASEIRRAIPESVPDQLWYRPDALGDAEADVLQAMQQVADDSTSTAAERLLAAEAGDAIRFVESMRRRYDVVLMNPPFGEPIPETKSYLRTSYPNASHDLYASFVARAIELLRPYGYVGALTNRTGFFIASAQRWREDVVGARSVVMADLGFGVLEGAVVEVAAYVLSTATRDRTTVLRLLRDVDKGAALARRALASEEERFVVDPRDFASISGSPFAYWTSEQIRRLFGTFPRLHSDRYSVDGGLQGTKDDPRFVRVWWEVLPDRRGQGRRWLPYSKGGEYAPYLGDIHLVVDWEDGARRIEEHILAQYPYLAGNADWILHRSDHYFAQGVTWAERTTSASSFWALPPGCVFSERGPAVIPSQPADSWALLALLNTRMYEHLIGMLVAAGSETSSGTPARHYTPGLVRSLPMPDSVSGDAPWRTLLGPLLAVRHSELARDETSLYYQGPIGPKPDLDAAFEASYRIEQRVAESLGLDEVALREIDRDQGPHPCTYPDITLDSGLVSRLSQMPTEELIDWVVSERGGLRFVTVKSYCVDRRIEILAHALKAHPRAVLRSLTELGVDPWDDAGDESHRVLAHLVGVAFGRFRAPLEAGLDPGRSLNPFAPLPLGSPAMGLGGDELRGIDGGRNPAVPHPPDGLLLDEPGSPLDLVEAIQRSAQLVFDGREELRAKLEPILGSSLRGYVRKRLFKDHVATYSKSRRKAPIYWQLSVPSRSWGVWVYAPALTREALFAIAGHTAHRQATGGEVLKALKIDRDQGGRGRNLRELNEQIAQEEDLALELEAFRREAERVAALGWEPDLDDGMPLCAAPLANLFPAWPAASEARQKLKAGEYKWSSVAEWASSL